MSVTIYGQKGYEYQYLASTYLILSFLKQGILESAVIDALDKEDLQLTIQLPSGIKQRLEVQFKKKKGVLDINQFATYFTHFNSHSDNVNVLSKLQTGTVDAYYLITDTRAKDFASNLTILANPNNLEKYGNNVIAKAEVQRLADAIKKQYAKPTSKPSPRNIFVRSQATAIENDPSEAERILRKTFLVDSLDDLALTKGIDSLLTATHIPVTKQRLLVFELLEQVTQFKGTNTNILKSFAKLLRDTVSNLPSVSEDHIASDNEQPLIQELETNGIILLTGVTMCGKTQSAYNVAQHIVSEDPSIVFYSTADIEEAKRILTDPVAEARLCYLEDPIDQKRIISDLSRLESLLRLLPRNKGRYLIVTCPLSILNQACADMYLLDYPWHDLTVKDRDFLKKIWQKVRDRESVKMSIIVDKIVLNALEKDEPSDLLQPGQMDYLSRNLAQLVSVTDTTVKHLANVGAKEIEQSILEQLDKDYIDAAIVLGITATTLAGPDTQDLDYLFTTEADYLPGIVSNEVGSLGSSLFDLEPGPVYTLNIYRSLHPVPSSILSAFERFNDLGYLKRLYTEFRFEHPTFQDGCRRILKTPSPSRFDRIVIFFLKAIGCLNERVAVNAVKSLDIPIDAFAGKAAQLQRLYAVAFKGMKSTFVNVRDLCVLFLINHYDKLSEEQQKLIMETVLQRSFGKETYQWQDGKVFIPDIDSMETGGLRDYEDRRKIQKDWNQFVKNPVVLHPEEGWRFLKRITKLSENDKSRVKLDIRALSIFNSYQESFIRERTCYLIAASCTDNEVKLIKELFQTENPFILYELVRGMFRSWPYLSSDYKDEMLLVLKEAFDNIFVPLSAMDLFTQFAAGHTSYTFDWEYDIEDCAAPDMWFLWAELMPIFFRHLPAELFIHKDRFLSTLREANISLEQKLGIGKAALAWLPKHLKSESPINLSEYLLLFIFDFMEQADSVQNVLLLQQMVSVDDCYFKAQVVRLIIERWEVFTSVEQDFCSNHISNASHRLQSVALTSVSVPVQVIDTILHCNSIEFDSPDMLMRCLGQRRLKECLGIIYLDRAYRYLSNTNRQGWSSVLLYLLHHPEEPCFLVALYSLIEDYSYDRIISHTWVDVETLYTNILKQKDKSINKHIFNFLLEGICNARHSNNKTLFNRFFKLISDEEKDIYGNMLAANTESILYMDNGANLPKDISKKYIQPKLYTQEVIRVFANSRFGHGEEDEKNFAFAIVAFITIKEIRTWKTYEQCRDWARNHKLRFTANQLQLIEDYSGYYFDLCRLQGEEIRSKNYAYFDQMDFVITKEM